MNNAAGLFFGNLCQVGNAVVCHALKNASFDIAPRVEQGFSVAWWKDKHNTHHAAPNEVRDDLQP